MPSHSVTRLRTSDEMDRIQHLEQLRQMVIAYLEAKFRDEDWHGVCDAATDLREIDAELRGIRGRT